MKTVQMAPLTTLKQRATRFGLGLGLAATLALGAVMPALAAPGVTITGTPVSATPGTITYSIDGGASGPTNTIALDGRAHTIAFTVPVAAVDHSGADAGWNNTVQLGAFTTGTVALGEGPLSVAKATSAACDTSSSQVCSNTNAAVMNGVATLASYTTGGAAVKMFSSDAGTHVAGIGMGQYTYSTPFTLTLPSTAKAGSYSSVLTVSAVSAP